MPLEIKAAELGMSSCRPVNMSCRKCPQIVEYVPLISSSSSMPTLPGAITSHHTHYEPQRRPVKSTVTVDAPDEHVAVADMPLAGLTSLAVLWDNDGLEQVEYKGQTL